MQHGGKAAYRNLEAVQDKASNQLLGASRSVAGAAAGGDLGWKKLEEGREVKKTDVWEETRRTGGQQVG